MRLSKRDAVASGLVAVAGLLYILWMAGSPLPNMGGTRATGIVVLALGFVASATAVVPSFNQLLHGNKVYLVVTSLIGAVAAVSGVLMLVDQSRTGLAVVIVSMVALWLIATIHHSLLAKQAKQR
jgi:uncharacterized membrane protein YqgA involved in biofilm formation